MILFPIILIFLISFLQKRDYVRLSPVNSLGSSANSSPGNGADPSHDPHSFSNNQYRSLAYLPGSVHGASQLQNPQQQQQHNNNNTALPSITTLGNAGNNIYNECKFRLLFRHSQASFVKISRHRVNFD